VQIFISSAGNKSDSLQSKNDRATRLLLSSGNFSNRVHYQLATHVDLTKGLEGTLVDYPLAKAGLPWRERLRNWTRWTTPTGKKIAIPPELSMNPNRHPPTILLSAPAEPALKLKSGRTKESKEAEKGDEPRYWSSDIFTETSVLFGSVLHSPLQPMPGRVSPEWLANDSFVHTFSTHVPNISQILGKATTQRDKVKGEHELHRLIVRFQPNPFYIPPSGKGEPVRGPLGSAALSVFPPIEMIFDIANDNSKSIKLKYIQAVVHEGKKDVMLPGSAVDLRFYQRATRKLKRRYIAPVEDFLKRSNLNILGSATLETPPSIIFPISNNICREPGFKLLDGKDSKTSSGSPNDVRNVEYLFAGLEIRRTRAFELGGWLLLYSSCEGGKAGGARSELRLRPRKHGKIKQEEDLVWFAYRVARIITIRGDDNEVMIKRVEAKESSRSPPMSLRKAKAKEQEGPWYFGDKYFAKKPLEFDGDEDEMVRWEPLSKEDSEEKDVSEGKGASKDEDAKECESGAGKGDS
jgi:hypothetical protein